MRKMFGVVIGIFGLVATTAMAETTWFNNNLNSWIMVSPAQLYQVQGNKVDASFEHKTGTNTTDTGTKTETELTGNSIGAIGVYSVGTDLKTGIAAGMNMVNLKTKGTDNKSDTKVTYLTPQAAYQVQNMASVGVALDAMFDSTDFGNSVKYDTSYFVVRPGALYSTKNTEVGLTYLTQVDQKAKTTVNGLDLEFPVQEPAEVIIHGRYAMSQDLALGGMLKHVMYSNLEQTDATTQTTWKNKDQEILRATAEFTTGAVKTEGGLAYTTAYYKDKDHMDNTNIGTMGLNAAADYSINKEAAVGGGLEYNFGNDKAGTTKFATNDMTIAVRGKVAF